MLYWKAKLRCVFPGGGEQLAIKYFVLFSGQLVVCTLCSCVMKTKQIWLFSAHMLPLLARLCLVPLETIVVINKFAMIFTGLEVLYFLASNLLVPYNLAKSAYRELVQVGCTWIITGSLAPIVVLLYILWSEKTVIAKCRPWLSFGS